MPVQLDKFPTTIKDAVAFTILVLPENYDYFKKVDYHNILDQLRKDYSGHARTFLKDLLKRIRSDSIEDTEQKIDLALKELSELAPVEWVLDRGNKTILRDGSCRYALIHLDLFINPNGAFACIDNKKMVWLEQPSKYGASFVQPPIY